MTSSRKNNWDEVMEGVNKAIPNKAADYHGPKTLSNILNRINARIGCEA